MLLRDQFIGLVLSLLVSGASFFSRARAFGASTVILMLSLGSVVFAGDPAFLRDSKGGIRGLVLDSSLENATRKRMQILDACSSAQKKSTAMPFQGFENSTLTLKMNSKIGAVALESAGHELGTELLAPYKNYPTSMNASTAPAGSRAPLAVMFATPFPGQKELNIQKGDIVEIHTDGQIYRYALAPMTVPPNGFLRLYPGTDDRLYYDAGLTHPVHEGRCKKRTK